MIVRPARPDDAAGVLAVQAEAAAERRTIATQPEEIRPVAEEAAMIAGRDPRSGVLLVAEDGARIVGICGIMRGRLLANAHTADLGVTVAASHRGGGIGRALMLAAEEWARGVGVRRITLGVFADNERARKLYLSLGYVEEGVRRGQYHMAGRDVDEVLMAKRVGGSP